MAAIFNTIILLGAVQGVIISILLFFTKRNRQSNRLLSTLIFLIAIASFNLYGNYQNWFNSNWLRFLVNFIPLVIVMPIGPLIYFYVQSSIDASFKMTKQQRIHFYPVIVDLIPALTAIIYILLVLSGLIKRYSAPWGQFIDSYNVYSDIPRWASVSIYVWLSYRYLCNIKGAQRAGIHEENIIWLQQFIRVFMVFQVIWLVYLVPYVIPRYTDFMLNTFDWYPLYIPMAILIYWLGIKGYMMRNSLVGTTRKPVGAGTILSPPIIQQTIDSLTAAMEKDKLYLNSNLNLNSVTEHTGIPQKIISAVLNQHLHKSFNEFINRYRIEAFKEKIQQEEMNHLTIAGIALECGFNSQATFQRTFKESTGMSPSEFRKIAV